jgi:hypothetical protein
MGKRWDEALMTSQRRWLLYSSSIGALSVLVIQCAVALKVASDCGNVRILSGELTVQEADAYCRYATGEREKVKALWGATWKEPIRIHVDSSYRISRALIPAYQGNRGFMEMPLQRVRNNDGALLHEIVHIYAPNKNRFLAEGLAVSLQAKMGGNRAFPNFSDNLNDLARRRFPEVNSLASLNNAGTTRPWSTVGDERTTAYILGGAFVGFLIDRNGLPRFKSLYETGDYDKVYGKSFEILEKEWRSALQEK